MDKNGVFIKKVDRERGFVKKDKWFGEFMRKDGKDEGGEGNISNSTHSTHITHIFQASCTFKTLQFTHVQFQHKFSTHIPRK